LYYGVERINVFIVAYSSWVGRLNEKISFEKFLTKVAPYRNIDQLINFIKRQGIQEQTYQGNGTFKTNFDRIFLSLKDSYDQDSRSKFDKKDPILIENEARQLAMLSIDLEQGNRSIFVTGDKRLQRCCSGTLLSKPGAMIISNRQFVQLVDLLLGLDIEEGSMARLLWGTTSSEEAVLLLNFFTNLALQHYSTAEATALPKVLDSFIPMVQASAKKENVQLFPWGSLESKSKKAKFLDRFEDRFYENMARAIKEYGDSKK
jgi:hypothetical protein